MTRAALYVRVSGPGQDLDTQEADLRRFAESQAWGPCEVFREHVTGTGSKARAEFDRLREVVRSRSVEVVIVTKLDRLGRSVRDVLGFFDECESSHVRVVVTTQSIDTETPTGRLTRTLLAAVAEFEGELIRERTRAAMAAIKEHRKPTKTGRPPGRPRKIVAEDVGRAEELREIGHTWPQIAQLLGRKAETLRRAVWASKPRPVAVVNPSAGETVVSQGGTRGRD
jgi:DNA invertase Pin-like site-specific DNA recombinase